MNNESKYTREERVNDLNEYLNMIDLDNETKSLLIKQIAMLRCSDMEIANGANEILRLQLDVMKGAAYGKIS